VAMALMTAVGAVAEAARGSDVAVFVEGDFEIPPLAYFDGRGFKPVHVAYVGEWDKAYCAPFQLPRRPGGLGLPEGAAALRDGPAAGSQRARRAEGPRPAEAATYFIGVVEVGGLNRFSCGEDEVGKRGE